MNRNITQRIFILFLLLALSCSKDFDTIIDDNFSFEFVEQHIPEGFIYEGVETSFTVTPEKKISTVNYFTQYEVIDGEGYYFNKKGDTIKPGTDIKLDSLKWAYSYIASDTGTHKIRVNSWDSNDNKKSLELIYQVAYAPFSFILSKGDDTFIINKNNPLTVNLVRDSENTSPDGEDNFKVIYQVENGTGKIIHEENTIEPGKEFNLSPGTTELKYVPETLGDHTIKATATAPDGATRTVELTVKVTHLDFTIDVNAESTSVQLDTDLALNVNLKNQDSTSNVTYEITHVYGEDSQGKAIIQNEQGNTLSAGEYNSIIPGSYKYNFKSSQNGIKKLFFDVRDSNGQQKKDSLQVDVTNVPFSFTGSTESKTVFVKQLAQLIFNLEATGNTENIEYKLTYEITQGNGKVLDQDNKPIPNNTPFSVDLGTFAFFYEPETLEDHEIKFIVTDNHGQESNPVVISLTAKHLDLSFKATANDSDVMIGEPAEVALNLIEKEEYEGVDYELSYFVSGGPGALYNGGNKLNQSEYFEVVPGNWSYNFIGEKNGTYEIAFLLRDSNGQVIDDQKVTIVVSENDFTVTATPSPPTEDANKPVSIILDIKEIPEGANETYEAFYSSNLSGKMIVGEQTYTPGQKFPLSPGVNVLTYTGTEPGEHLLNFSVESSAGVTHPAEATVTLSQVDFDFSASAQKTEISVGEITTIGFNVTTQGNSNVDYTMRYSIDGNAKITDSNGNPVSAGNVINIQQGNFSWNFEGTTDNTVKLTFYVKSSTGLEKPAEVTIVVSPKEYNFSAQASQGEAYTGEPVDIVFNVTEIGTGGDTYEAYFNSGTSTGKLIYDGQEYGPGQTFTLPTGTSTGQYIGTSANTHNITFNAQSSSGVKRDDFTTIKYENYVEPFSFNITQQSGIKTKDTPFEFYVSTNATSGHNSDVDYTLNYSFGSVNAGFITYNGIKYDAGQDIPIQYGNTTLEFTPTTDEDFNINFVVNNSTGESEATNQNVDMIKAPIAWTKGEKHNVSCGGLNGCDYEVRIYVCSSNGCSQAFDNASLTKVQIIINDRKDGGEDPFNFNYSEAQGDGSDMYFRLEKRGSEHDLHYLDQTFRIRVQDSNGEWSEWVEGRVNRV